MRNHYSAVLCVLLFFCAIQVNAQVKIGDNPNTINQNSILELESSNKGFVLPRVALIDVSSSNPLNTDLLAGTIVFNTSNTTAGGSGAGLYTWDGNKWQSQNVSGGWQLTGNNSVDANANFLGTTDSAGLSFRTANTEAIHIDSLQHVSIGVANTTYKFEQAGTFRIHKDSFNIMYEPDIFPSFIPGIQFSGGILNLTDAGKTLNGIAYLPTDDPEAVAVTGYLNPTTFEQAIVSAQKGGVNIGVNSSNGSANMGAQSGQVYLNASSHGSNDTSSNVELSTWATRLNHYVQNVGGTSADFSDSTINFNANENVDNSRNSGLSLNPWSVNVNANDNNNGLHANSNLNVNNYSVNIQDNNQQMNSGHFQTASQLQLGVNDNVNDVHTNMNMDSTLWINLNRPGLNSGLNISANYINLYKNDFSDGKNSNLNISLDTLMFGMGSTSDYSSFIVSRTFALFNSSTGNFSVGIGNNAPQANLDVSGSIRSTNLTGGGTVMADNNGVLYLNSSIIENKVNYTYSFSAPTIITGGTIEIAAGGDYSAGATDIVITLPANNLTSTQASVNVSPDQDLPQNVSIASARLISTSEVKVRFLNHGTSNQTISGQLFITVTQY